MSFAVQTEKARDVTLQCSILASALVFHFGYEHSFQTPKILAFLPILLLLLITGRRQGFSYCEVFLIGFPLTSLAWAIHYKLWADALLPLLFYACAFMVSPNERDKSSIRKGLALSGPLVALYVLIQKVGLDPLSFHQGADAGGFMGNTNYSAHYLLLCLCLGQFGSPWFKRLGWVLMVLGVILCQSRAVWLATMVLIFFQFPFRSWGRGPLIGLSTTGLVLLIGGMLIWRADLKEGYHWITHMDHYEAAFREQPRPDPDPEAPDLRDPWFQGKRFSLMTRYMLMGNSLKAAVDHGLTGAGLGQFHVVYPRYSQELLPDVNMNEVYRASSAHNLILDGVITLGLPWFMVLVLYMVGVWRESSRDVRLALGLQVAVAMVSLNYLNPVIVGVFILLRPKERSVSKAGVRILGGFLVCLILCFSWLDLKSGDPHQIWPPVLFPDRLARQAYDHGRMDAAWRFQLQALDQDPHGPETLYNLGLIAWELEAPWGRETAWTAFRLVTQLHPHYRPARKMLAELELEGFVVRDGERIDYQQFRAGLQP